MNADEQIKDLREKLARANDERVREGNRAYDAERALARTQAELAEVNYLWSPHIGEHEGGDTVKLGPGDRLCPLTADGMPVALVTEVEALRAALAVQAAAVRQHDAAQATLRAAEARDAATLRRREATPGDTLAELAAAREEAQRWNARATELETERDETLRRVRVALGALGVADCDDPIAALEALAEEVPRREAEALDERNAAVLRAYAGGEARGVQKALEALRRRLADVVAPLGGRAYGYNVDKLATQADTLDDAVASVAALTPSKGAEVSRG